MMTTPAPGAAAGTSAAPATAAPRRITWAAYLPAAAGVGYVAAWIGGLSAWPVNLALNATGAQVTAAHAAHPAEAATQYLLTEGLAGILFGVILGCALISRVRGTQTARDRGVTAGAATLGAAAMITSIAQSVIGLVLTAAATSHDITRAGDLATLLSRLDGVKMLALAGAAALLAASAKPGPALPRWLRAGTIPLGVALAASGYAYLTLTNGLAWTAFVSGILLLAWMAGTGISLTIRNTRPRRAARQPAVHAGLMIG